MESLKPIADSVPYIKRISAMVNIRAEYVLIILSLISLLIIRRTIFGGILSSILSLYIPVRDSILAIRSPNPKVSELKMLLTVFVVFSMFIFLESLGVSQIIPLFSIAKIVLLYWASSSEDHTNIITELLLKKVPHEWLHLGDSIESAVKKAAKSVEGKVNIKKDTIEFKRK